MSITINSAFLHVVLINTKTQTSSTMIFIQISFREHLLEHAGTLVKLFESVSEVHTDFTHSDWLKNIPFSNLYNYLKQIKINATIFKAANLRLTTKYNSTHLRYIKLVVI